jgi:hypothetical protein
MRLYSVHEIQMCTESWRWQPTQVLQHVSQSVHDGHHGTEEDAARFRVGLGSEIESTGTYLDLASMPPYRVPRP